MEYLFLLLGLAVLSISGNYLVDGSVSLARHLNISTLVVGIVVVSFGTSAPELVVSIQGAVDGHPDIAIGNVVGSNIANIALVLGLTAIILPIPVRSTSIKFDWPVMMASSIILYLFMLNLSIERWEGAILFILIIAYIFWTLRSSMKEKNKDEVKEKPKFNLAISIILVVVSCVGLVYGAKWLVNSAADIARSFDVSERVISVTLIAFGTSVPELAASVMAAIKKQMDISIGNIIGSNIFNILAILGITGLIQDKINIDKGIATFDIYWMLGIALLLFLLIIPLKGGILKRWKGLLLLIVYSVYIYLLFNLKS